MSGIGKILPVEGYIAILEGDLPVAYQTSLSHLYQPLLGPHAVMLYQTLLGEVDIQRGKLQTHHTLMNYLNLPLDDIYYSRLRLEGIGLMKTYETEMENRKVYIYELQCPFSPGNFFQDDMLSQLLYHHIGENTYKKLERSFTREDNHTSLKQVTASFHDVFKTYTSYSESTTQQKRPGYKFGSDVEEADFTYIEQRLLQQMIPVDQVLTGTNKRLILQMKELYALAEYEIEKTLLWALDEQNKLNKNEFKEACHDLFLAKQQTAPIQLKDKQETSSQSNNQYQPTTKDERLIDNFEKSSPKQVLEDFSQGNHASPQDMKVIGDVMMTQGLSTPVMNVLIHYVLLQSNMKLSKPYLETIASHWSRANLTTAKEAMAFAKNQRAVSNHAKKNKRNKQHNVSNEVIPEWFQEQENAKDKKKQEQEQTHSIKNEEKEVSEVAKLLKEFTKNQ